MYRVHVNAHRSWNMGMDQSDNDSFKIETKDLTSDNTNLTAFTSDPALKIDSSGNATFSENVSANRFIMTSDKRLKKNIKELDKEEIENNFKNLNSVKFKWKKHAKNNTNNPHSYNYGLIAQNVKECFPNCVYEKK